MRLSACKTVVYSVLAVVYTTDNYLLFNNLWENTIIIFYFADSFMCFLVPALCPQRYKFTMYKLNCIQMGAISALSTVRGLYLHLIYGLKIIQT